MEWENIGLGGLRVGLAVGDTNSFKLQRAF